MKSNQRMKKRWNDRKRRQLTKKRPGMTDRLRNELEKKINVPSTHGDLQKRVMEKKKKEFGFGKFQTGKFFQCQENSIQRMENQLTRNRESQTQNYANSNSLVYCGILALTVYFFA
jgi:hypothetical protein